jgi:hypothetical protein
MTEIETWWMVQHFIVAVANENSLPIDDICVHLAEVQKDGMSSTHRGNVSGNRPEGLTSPKRISTIPWPVSWPPNQEWMTVGVLSAQGMVVAVPASVMIIYQHVSGKALVIRPEKSMD